MTTSNASLSAADVHDPFPDLRDHIHRHFATSTLGERFLFRVSVRANLYELFLSKLPGSMRQHYNCNACRNFSRRFGSLVKVDQAGRIESVVWNAAGAPEPFAAAVAAVAREVNSGHIMEVVLTDEEVWGTPQTGEWSHLYLSPHRDLLSEKSRIDTFEQRAAAKRESVGMLGRILEDYSAEVLRKAQALFESGQLAREGEAHRANVAWLIRVRESYDSAHKGRAKNVLWRYAAEAPTGWCNVRQGMIGTLLDDVKAGKSFDAIRAAYGTKMEPIKYQRPQAPPKEGNIDQAEKVIEAMGARNALMRRFALLSDVQTLWKEPEAPPKNPKGSGGTFDHLRKQEHDRSVVDAPGAQIMTLEKFRKTILPEADKIEIMTRLGRMPFAAFTAPVDPEAPLLFQWNNGISWYFYHQGSTPDEWNIPAGGWVDVHAVALSPNLWDDGAASYKHKGIMFCIRGAKDVRHTAGSGLFPEILRAEYHRVRGTIEAHSNSTPIEGRDAAEACGLMFKTGGPWDCCLRITAKGIRSQIKLDRWD